MKKYIIVFLAVLTYGVVTAAPIKSNLSAKIMNLTKEEDSGWKDSTAKNYVQDGLIHMWDGIENAGWGVHDISPSAWKDLKGNEDLTLAGNISIQDDHMYFDGMSAVYTGHRIYGYVYVEVVAYKRFNSQNCTIYSGGLSDACLQIFSNGRTHIRERQGITSPNFYRTNMNVVAYIDYSANMFNLNGQEYQCVQVPAAYSSARQFSIGAHNAATSIAGSTALLGKVFCVRLYSRVLTAQEQEANHTVDKERFGL